MPPRCTAWMPSFIMSIRHRTRWDRPSVGIGRAFQLVTCLVVWLECSITKVVFPKLRIPVYVANSRLCLGEIIIHAGHQTASAYKLKTLYLLKALEQPRPETVAVVGIFVPGKGKFLNWISVDPLGSLQYILVFFLIGTICHAYTWCMLDVSKIIQLELWV